MREEKHSPSCYTLMFHAVVLVIKDKHQQNKDYLQRKLQKLHRIPLTSSDNICQASKPNCIQ